MGNYSHALHEAALATRKEVQRDQSGRAYGVRETWAISGILQAADQASLQAAINALEAAYGRDYQDIALLFDDGTIARQMKGRTPLGGVTVTAGPSFPEDGKATAEYSFFRTYAVEVTGEYQLPGAALQQLLTWQERLSVQGSGGPKFVLRQPLIGPPVRYQVAERSPIQVSQDGQATGLLDYPTPPGPVLPPWEHQDRRRVDRDAPKRSGNQYREFTLSWHYEMEAVPPVAVLRPNYWR